MLKKATVASAILIGTTLAEKQESLGEIMGLTDEQLAENGLTVLEGLEAEDLLAEVEDESDSDSDLDDDLAEEEDESDDDSEDEDVQELAEEEYETPEALDYFAEIYPDHTEEQILAALTDADKEEWGFFKKVFKKTKRFFKKTVKKAKKFVKKTYSRVKRGVKRTWGRVKKVAKKVGRTVVRGVKKFAKSKVGRMVIGAGKQFLQSQFGQYYNMGMMAFSALRGQPMQQEI